MAHPIQAVQELAGAAGADPRPLQRTTVFQGLNDGPATLAAKITGVSKGGKREDDALYHTNNDGRPWPTPTHSKTIGGIPVASDIFLFQKQQAFNRHKLLERMVHPCGSGAFGYFETTKDVSHLTKAHFLRGSGVRTPIFIRYSTVTLGREFPDLARNPRGFAVKFYTGEGNYDIVGLNFPVFFCRDPIQGPDVIRSQGRRPDNFLLDYNATFDLLAHTPEANHAGMMFFSDHGTPNGWHSNHGYGCHTFKWVNKEGKFVYIKYHFIADKGQKQFTRQEAVEMSGINPDYSKQELWQAIERGDPISYTAHVQVMQPEEADPVKLGFDPFDVTKVWPRDQFPMQEFGKLHVTKNPENYHRDVDQACFSPGAMVPGIEDSPDPLLQFRMFFYRDAQFHRVGTNYHQIPVNCPFMAASMSSLNFDGVMRTDANNGGNPDYAPNSFEPLTKFRPDTAEAPYKVSDAVVSRKSHFYHEGKLSDYDQPRVLYEKVMTDAQRDHLHSNTAVMLAQVSEPKIQVLYLGQQYCIKPSYAKAIYDLLPEKKFDFSEVESAAKGAETRTKDPHFMHNNDQERLVGLPVSGVYNF
ncbi:Peroxisomal catalase 1 [Exophiala dermatitidis]